MTGRKRIREGLDPHRRRGHTLDGSTPSRFFQPNPTQTSEPTKRARSKSFPTQANIFHTRQPRFSLTPPSPLAIPPDQEGIAAVQVPPAPTHKSTTKGFRS